MLKFLHIGYPKCFSTTLQRNFFSKQPEIHYGGIGINSNIDFANDELNLLIESGILYFNRTLYNRTKKRFKRAIEEFELSAEKEKRILGLSSEHMLFNFSPQGNDYQEKIDRLLDLFGKNTKLIIILRDQKSLIMSLYKEYVRLGYPYPYTDFIEWIYKYQDRNFYHELMYGQVVENLFNAFIPENIYVDWFENYKTNNRVNLGELFKRISSFLGITYHAIPIANFMPSMSDEITESKRILNSKTRHDLGRTHLEGFQDHRNRIFLNNILDLNLSEDTIYRDVAIKRDLIQKAADLSKKKTFAQDKPLIFDKMVREFNESNQYLKAFLKQIKGG